jgi:glycosyltransferase involved in cell wall biosynthesis
MTIGDVKNLMQLTGLEPVTTTRRILFPLKIPVLSAFLNGVVGPLPIVRHLSLTWWIVARKRPPDEPEELSVSIVVPARDEAGMIERIISETPELGSRCELIFVEGHSTDGTKEEIERQIALHPDREIVYFQQTGKGKGDAVRLGFAHATGELLMILDADLTVPPEDLPAFYDVMAHGQADYVQGTRLVYPMEPGAMRFFNKLGNVAFSQLFTYLLQQPIKDTLCGTKVLWRRDYERIAAARAHFGDFDPFGDFDLIFGAARLNLKIAEIPIRYRDRTYGETNISRWKHGWLLLRMSGIAARKIKFV